MIRSKSRSRSRTCISVSVVREGERSRPGRRVGRRGEAGGVCAEQRWLHTAVWVFGEPNFFAVRM